MKGSGGLLALSLLFLVLAAPVWATGADEAGASGPASNLAADEAGVSAPPGGDDDPRGGDGPFLPAPPGEEAPSFSGPPEGDSPDGEDAPFFSGDDAPLDGEQRGDGDEANQNFSFDHRYRTGVSVNETTGLLNFLTGNEITRQFRLANSYEQTIRIEKPGSETNFVKFSIDFTQSYEAKSKQFIDSQVLFSEVYHRIIQGSHQVRWGNQVFRLGKVDFGSPIDVLHVQNLFSLVTFDSTTTKKALPAVKYDWSGASRNFTFYAAPLGQRTFGMKFTRFKDDAERRDQGEDPEGELLLREYAGAQHQWSGASFDLRLGFFHWFDRNPTISWRYDPSPAEGELPSFEGLFRSYREEESQTNFGTFELDATLGSVGWKMDVGYFDRKNFYEYRVDTDGSVHFDTVSVPYFGLASSWEKAFSQLLVLLVYNHEALKDVPAGSHILFFENEASPVPRQRELEQQGLTGVFIWRRGEGQKATLLLSRTAPFEVTRAAAAWNWKGAGKNSGEWSARLVHLKTEIQAFTGNAIESNQVMAGYTVFFSGLRSG